MPAAKIPKNEHKRLTSLHNLQVLDTEPEAEFDVLVKVAALVCDVPIGLISLIDADRQWFKANIGLPGVTETPRDMAFCAHAIHEDGILVVNDAKKDPRFNDNPLVTGNPNIRFYAGATLKLSDGKNVGTLCVIDIKPHKLNDIQLQILSNLAKAAVKALEGKRALLAESKLIEANQFSKAVIENSFDAVISVKTDGTISHWNSAAEKLYGYSKSEIIDTNYLKLVPADLLEKHVDLTTRFQEHPNGTTFETVRQHKNGELIPVSISVSPVRNKQNKITSATKIVRDNREKLKNQQALSDNKKLLDTMGELAEVGGWRLDLASNELTWTNTTFTIHALPLDYKPNLQEAINFYTPEAIVKLEHAIETAINNGLGWSLELPFIQADGTPIWVRSQGNVEYIDNKPALLIGSIQDITDIVNNREALNASNQTMLLATDSGGIGIWHYDIINNSLFWDDWMYKIYCVKREENILPYTIWSNHLHLDDVANTELALQDAINGIRPYNVEFRIVRDDGSVRYIKATATVKLNEHGQAVRMIGTNTDVTEFNQLSVELKEKNDLLRVTLESIADGVITTDAQSRVTWLNPVAERMTGWLTKEAIGLLISQIFNIVHEETRQPAENPIVTCIEQNKVVGMASHTLLISRDGSEYGIEDSAAPILSANSELLGAVLVFHDVSEQRRLSGEMSYRATHDSLTGLINRSEFESRLQRVLVQAHSDLSKHSVLYIDLDQFKLVNDACGHSAGDTLLQQVGKMLSDSVRARDSIARLGGDEFAIILEKCSAEKAQEIAEKICDKMDHFRFIHDSKRFRVGTSIGLVQFDQHWVSIAAIMQAADTSCYIAKEAGRNRVHVFFDTDLAMHKRQGETQWASKLENALDENKFKLFAQRIESANQNNKLLHAEILLRMVNDDGTLTAPGLFIPAAERFHLAARVDRWVLLNTIEWLQSLDSLAGIERICINLSGQSVGDRAFHRQAIDILNIAGDEICNKICIEITETVAVSNLADASAFISQLHQLGIIIALDDFGAGSSSFGYLKTLDVDVLKIDGQFIKNMIHDPLDVSAVRCFVEVANIVGLKTVAEFVETQEIMDRVRAIGIDYAQGYLIHKPEPIENLKLMQANYLA